MRSPCTYRSPGTCSASGSTASILPRSTSTVRGSLPCWITPATMSPSCPAYSPNVISSSTSRNRCRITCLAVVAAIRPKPAGVSSYSRAVAPSTPVSRAHTVTWPVFLSTSTRAAGLAPSVLWYAINSASSIALMTVSSEMSFSLSRLRSTLRSMSIAASSQIRLVGKLLVRYPVVDSGAGKLVKFRVGQPPELHLDGTRAQIPIAEPVLGTVDVQRDAIGVRREHPALHRPRTRLNPHQPPGRTPPVPRLGERAVHAGRGNLQRVGHVAHHVGRVKGGRHVPADLGRVVQADTVIAVDHHAQQPPPSGHARPHRLQVHPGRRHHGPDQAGQPRFVHRTGDGAVATGHHDLLVCEPSINLGSYIFAGPAYRATEATRRRCLGTANPPQPQQP